MKLIPVEQLNFGRDTDIPGRGYMSSVTARERHEVDLWLEERLFVVTFNPRDENQKVAVRFYGIEGGLSFESKAMAQAVAEYKAKAKKAA